MDVRPDTRDIGFLIKLIYDAIDRRINRKLAKHDLTNTQMAVLAFLRSREGAHTTISDVQTFLNVSHPTCAGIIKRLQKKGFLYALVDPEDHRARVLKLNDSAPSPLPGSETPTQEMERTLLRGFSKEEARLLMEMLDRVYQNIR